MLAFSAWLMFRAVRHWPLIIAAAPGAALAVATKYTGLLFVPVIAVLPVLIAHAGRYRRATLCTIGFSIVIAALLAWGLKLGGRQYMTAFSTTTTSRPQGIPPSSPS